MTGCNATLTTTDVEPCPHDLTPGYCVPDDHYDDCIKDHFDYTGGNGWIRALVTVIECRGEDTDPLSCFTDTNGNNCHGNDFAGVEWMDDTPGATPHTDQLVTDAEVQAAWREITGSGSVPPTRTDISRALRAAAEVRQEAGDA